MYVYMNPSSADEPQFGDCLRRCTVLPGSGRHSKDCRQHQ